MFVPKAAATPEKELLRLIEDPRSKEKKESETHAARHSRLSLFSMGAWLGRLSFVKERFAEWFHSGNSDSPLDIKVINRLLALTVVFLGIYFAHNLWGGVKNLNRLPDFSLKIENGMTAQAGEQESLLKKAVSYYLEKAAARDIFKMGAKESIASPTEKISEAVKNLRLVGISWSDNPDVMIEDSKALRTFFVKRGQMIGEVKVEAVFKDRVVLSYAGEEMELK